MSEDDARDLIEEALPPEVAARAALDGLEARVEASPDGPLRDTFLGICRQLRQHL